MLSIKNYPCIVSLCSGEGGRSEEGCANRQINVCRKTLRGVKGCQDFDDLHWIINMDSINPAKKVLPILPTRG